MQRSLLHRSTLGTACAALGLAVGGCGAAGSAPSGGPASPTAAEPLVLPDADAGRLAAVALDAWALGRSATGYRLQGCSRADAATAECVANLEFADNPTNPQTCRLAITVLATTPTVGTEEPSSTQLVRGVEIEQYPLSNGGYATYRYGDEQRCNQAQYASGF